MIRKPSLDEQTLRIAESMLRMPPKQHDEMKIANQKIYPSNRKRGQLARAVFIRAKLEARN
jgi:hypothetical protein